MSAHEVYAAITKQPGRFEQGMMRTALARLLDWLAPVSDPEPSWLDREDGAGTRKPLCSVIGCPNDPTTAPHGWAVCDAHCPANV